jgi:hypothetical protein
MRRDTKLVQIPEDLMEILALISYACGYSYGRTTKQGVFGTYSEYSEISIREHLLIFVRAFNISTGSKHPSGCFDFHGPGFLPV